MTPHESEKHFSDFLGELQERFDFSVAFQIRVSPQRKQDSNRRLKLPELWPRDVSNIMWPNSGSPNIMHGVDEMKTLMTKHSEYDNSDYYNLLSVYDSEVYDYMLK